MLFSVTACGGGDEPQPAPTTASPASIEPTTAAPEATTPTPNSTAEDAAPTETTEPAAEGSPSLPARTEMDGATRIFAEAFFVQRMREEGIGQLYTDDELVAGGDAACDALDGGKPIRGILVDVAEILPRLESTDAVAILAGDASGILCPEHAPQR